MAYYIFAEIGATAGSNADYAAGAVISPEFFSVFSVQPQIGRLFSPDEQKIGGPLVTLISNAFCRRNYGGSPQVIGQILRTENMAFTIVGVMPRGFRFPGANDFWIPMSAFQKPGEIEDRGAHNYMKVNHRLRR